MSKYATMTIDFDREKKIQAGIYTAVIAGALLLIVWFVKFYQPVVPPPPKEEYIEISLPDVPPPAEDVNLGNNDVGTGKVQPIVTGTPSSNPVSHNEAPSKSVASQQVTRDFDEDNDRNAPPITKPATPNTSKEINNNATDQSTTTKPDPRPRAVMTSTRGSGTGGNTDVPGMNRPGGHGPGDGPGDKGTYNGDPKGTSYGPRVTKGDRRIVRSQNLTGELRSAIIYAEISVSPEGKGTFLRITKGMQTAAYKNEIRRHLDKISFNKSDHESKVTVEFIFEQGG